MYDGDEPLLGTWKDIWEHKKKVLMDHQKKKKKTYMEKKVQSEIYKGLVEPSHQWIKCNINPAKVSAIINMQEQMIETRAWKCNKGLVVDTDLCKLWGEVPEGVMHITSGCKMLASRKYMTRHNNLLKILMVAWCKENKLMERDHAWYKVKWGQEAVVENEHVKIS